MGKALDTYDMSGAVANAAVLVRDGFQSIGGYYFHSSAFKQLLTRDVARKLSAAGLYVFSVWEDGQPTHGSYFSTIKGQIDGARAAACALEAGQPTGTPIYAAYDYDAAPGDLPGIDAYAEAFRAALTSHGYTAGCYASGLVCRRLKAAGLVEKTWLTQSTGFAGHADWLPQADIVQGPSCVLHGIDIDTDITNGNAGGWKAPNEAPCKTSPLYSHVQAT